MANQYVNKVEVNGITIIDLTNDTVTAGSLAQGYTAHDASGAVITGTMSGGNRTPRSLVVYGNSEQDGTPATSNPVDIESVAPPNLSPFFSNVPISAAGRYWSGTNSYWSAESDGWAHYSRTVEADTNSNLAILPQSAFKAGKSYTILLEWEDVIVSGDVSMYTVAGSAYQIDSISSEAGGEFIITAGSGSATRVVNCVHDSDESGITRFIYWRTRVLANSSVDGDFRISIYEGEYDDGYLPCDSIGFVSVDGTNADTIPIPVDGHELRGLPNGTRDELRLTYEGEGTTDGYGSYRSTLIQRVDITTTATTDGISATIGTDAMSTTGTLADGATVIYALADELVLDLGTVELPALPSSAITSYVSAAPTAEIGIFYSILQTKSVSPSTSQQSVSPDSGYDGLSSVTVGAIPSEYIVPSGSETKTANGTYDVTALAQLIVNVASPVKTATGTFTGNGTRTIDVTCAFEPDIVYFTSDPGTTASSGTVAAIIVRGMMAATRYRNNSTTNSHYGVPDITDMNTGGTSYSWRATYDSSTSKVTLYCFSNNARALLTNGRTYNVQFLKWT